MRIVMVLLALALGAPVWATDDPTPDAALGASVYAERCSLCHGPHGLGEGMLPLRIRRYPNTNLITKSRFAAKELRDVIIFGGTREDVDPLMPPMGNELTWTEIESVAIFVELLRQDETESRHLLRRQAAQVVPSLRHGMHIFNSRCTLCHGDFGEGDGRMARIIKDPPPANLAVSTLAESDMLAIISAGGEAIGRSEQMPPWADQLSLPDIQSVILYIKSLQERTR